MLLTTSNLELLNLARGRVFRFGTNPAASHILLARIIYEPFSDLQNVQMEKDLRLSCPEHRANQPQRAGVRFVRRLQQPWASALRLMNNPGQRPGLSSLQELR